MWFAGIFLGILTGLGFIALAVGYLLGFYCLMRIVYSIAARFIRNPDNRLVFLAFVVIPLFILYDGTVRHRDPLYLYHTGKALREQEKKSQPITPQTLNELHQSDHDGGDILHKTEKEVNYP
ncbi:hypothetical protein [Rodentibacter trehalosifermentans]|uniref:Uncharacterized protein n=1 Tax=Rodentibacter trehalosifermentans TaxID=1908263 RepID=A0A1V3IW98_9PAST|nr:hypothetical protein [Rodentibacter trehalosifermentans]OOF46566.1 hypothetical protein BKK51_02115 [Rodentibacter trehalosifermentans]OOF48342.1 hypothetical protein BKK52_06260 [Rodentibacter trehalosifermentans]OOF52802.1 hypothetical protein BKK53_03615 [Rodentibacter trehalosifermentans]